MTAQYMPKTLAKTLTYLLTVAPGEHGLFWSPDGTMPWKELYWTLQEDESLRYVREMHLKEIAYLGIELPVVLDGSLLRLKEGIPVPVYPPVQAPPERLYHACRRKQYLTASRNGFVPAGRPFIPLSSDKGLALRLGSRRDPEPLLVEIFAARAASEGIAFLQAGPTLFLAEALPVQYLLFPPVREDFLAKAAARSKARSEARRERVQSSPTPGSFFMDVGHFQESAPGGGLQGKDGKKGRRGAEWKRAARKERNKRNV